MIGLTGVTAVPRLTNIFTSHTTYLNRKFNSLSYHPEIYTNQTDIVLVAIKSHHRAIQFRLIVFFFFLDITC